MSQDICFGCGVVISTTYSPNNNEGYFLSQERIEAQLEPEIDRGAFKEMNVYAVLKKIGALPLVICDACQAEG